MDAFLAWYNSLPPELQTLLLGGAADATGGLAAQIVVGLVGWTGGKVRKAISPDPQKQALSRAVAYALDQTARTLDGGDLDRRKWWIGELGEWLKREEVQLQFYRLIEPLPDAQPDLAILRTEFDAIGHKNLLTDGDDFAAMVAAFARSFEDGAALQPDLKNKVDTTQLRRIVAGLEEIAQSQRDQAAVARDIRATLERFPVLDLSALERAYLRGLYDECNHIKLVEDERAIPGQSKGPRLQRVYVNLTTKQAPSFEDLPDRLRIPRARHREALNALRRRARVDEPQAAARRAGTAAEPDERAAIDALRRLDEDDRKALAGELGVAPDDLAAALANLSPLDVLRRTPQLVLLGNPGSGKSTLVLRLSALLAAAGAGDDGILADLGEQEVRDMGELLTTLGSRLLPVRIVLSRWTRFRENPCAQDLIDECVRVVGEAGGMADAQTTDFVNRLIAQTPSVLLLLDGLDEVTEQAQRDKQFAAVADFARHHGKTPLIVTCRVRPYEAWEMAGKALPLRKHELDRLADPAIEQFIARWYAELLDAGVYSDKAKADGAADHLCSEIFDAAGPNHGDLYDMAGTPLLLTMMAHVNYDRPLPDSRAALYHSFVEQLLYKWEESKLRKGETTRLSQLFDEARTNGGLFKLRLAEMAYDLYRAASERDLVEFDADRLEKALRLLPAGMEEEPRAAWAVSVRKFIAARSGLITALSDQSFKFTHLSFQEYLAAWHLITGTEKERKERFLQWVDNVNWREIILLAIGLLVKVEPVRHSEALLIVDGLLQSSLDKPARLLLLGDAYRLLAAESLRTASSPRYAQTVLGDLSARLTGLMQSTKAAAEDRLNAGLLLADLAEDLAGVEAALLPPRFSLDPPGLDAFIPIPGLKVRIGKYPVTNAQFKRFVDAGGYAPENETRWWSKPGIKYKRQFDWTEPRYGDDRRFNRATQPVVGVSWYEAEAYCNWLRASRIGLNDGERARLPTQAEWEAAARGGQPKPTDDAQDYPWRGPFKPALANTKESNLGQTVPVHMHRAGATSDEGICDLIGNVWEWTQDPYKGIEDAYWLVGGSWYDEAQSISAARSGYLARHLRFDSRGFRVVAVPGLS